LERLVSKFGDTEQHRRAVQQISHIADLSLGRKRVGSMYYPDHPNSGIHFDFEWSNLFLPDRPVLHFNAYNLSDQRPELFINRHNHPLYKPMTIQSLMAWSALPYILEPIEIEKKIYCEGATVDTVNFRDLLDNHPDLDEIWVIRILAKNQIHPPKTLLDAFNNLVMHFASTTSEDSIALFRLYLQERGSRVRIVEVPVYGDIRYEWLYDNLEQSIQGGYAEADKVVRAYRPRMGLVSPPMTLVDRVSSWKDQKLTDAAQHIRHMPDRNPDAVLAAVATELALFAAELPKYMIMARHVCEGHDGASGLRDLHAAHHNSLSVVKDCLEEIDDRAMQVGDYESVHTAAKAISLLQHIDRSLRYGGHHHRSFEGNPPDAICRGGDRRHGSFRRRSSASKLPFAEVTFVYPSRANRVIRA
jgi:hypothetical protein